RDDLEDYYEDLAERREEYLEDRQDYLEDLADRREDAIEDYYDRLPKAYRHHAWRPPLAVAPGYGLPVPSYGYRYAPYAVRPYPGPLGYAYGGYGLGRVAPYYGYGGSAPYGYGPYGPLRRGGIDIPFGFGLGGLSIRW